MARLIYCPVWFEVLEGSFLVVGKGQKKMDLTEIGKIHFCGYGKNCYNFFSVIA